MTELLTDCFRGVALAAALGVPLYAAKVRGRTYAGFAGVILGLCLPGAIVSEARITAFVGEDLRAWIAFAFVYGVAAAGLHLGHLVRARLRSPWFRWAVSVPGQTFVAAGFMSGVWLLAWLPVRLALWGLEADRWLDALRWLDLAPYAVAAISVGTSVGGSVGRRIEWVRIPLGADGPEAVARVPVERSRRPAGAPADALRIVQITDPHVGPWQPIRRLQRSIERLLAEEPDLVLLTGDFLTMEAAGSPGALSQALEPLRAASDRCYAIFGNHDHEAPEEVRAALRENGIRLLVDEAVVVSTRCGPVQLVGADYVGRGRREHLEGLLERFPRVDALRLLLLHDPLGFQHVPPGEVDLTLSGHTHGGQVGLVSLGFDWTVLKRSPWPDHGLFALGSNRLYVHRGTGFYGFPLRIGVPGEHSVLELVPALD